MGDRFVRDWIERYCVVIVSITAAVLLLVRAPSNLTENFQNVVNASIDVSGILIGFLMTSLAILFALPENPFMKFLKDSRAFEKIIKYSRTSLWIWVFVLSLSLTLQYWDARDNEYRPVMFKGLTVSLVAGVCAVGRTVLHHTQMLLLNNRPRREGDAGIHWVEPGEKPPTDP